ncbi:MAG: hypothetical protein RBR24_10400 [Candidatus Carbobacillus sp.]|nr:hypothetical protein [Candidatus Carbobacillus sp.]
MLASNDNVFQKVSLEPSLSLKTWRVMYLLVLSGAALLLILYLWYRLHLTASITTIRQQTERLMQENMLIQNKINTLHHAIESIGGETNAERIKTHTVGIPASPEETTFIRWIDQAAQKHALTVVRLEMLDRTPFEPLDQEGGSGIRQAPLTLAWQTEYQLHVLGTYGDWLSFLQTLEEDASRFMSVKSMNITLKDRTNITDQQTIFHDDTAVDVTCVVHTYDWNDTEER